MPKNNIDGYEPLILSTVELLDQHWPACEPLLRRCTERADFDEMDPVDIYNAVRQGAAYIFVVKKDTVDGPDVKLVLAVEVVKYPKMSTFNILALGGEDLMLCHDKFWKAFCGWAYMSGVRAIEGRVSEAIEKMIQPIGFKRAFVQVRFPLSGN